MPPSGRNGGFRTACTVIATVSVLAWAISNLLWCSDDSTRSAIWRQAPLLQLRQPAKAAKAAAASTSAAARRHMVPESANGAAAKPSSAAAEATADGPGCSCGWQQPPRIAEPLQGNPLWAAFQAQTKGPVIRKWSPYFDIYHRYFQRFRGQEVTFLEIGVQSGGSIGLWQTYFGADKLTYYGVDVNLYCQELFHNPPRVRILIGDQGSRDWWADFRKQAATANLTFDIILDDGGHEMKQQIVTYEEAWPLLADGGVYICEDTSTSMDTIEAFDYRAPPKKAGTPSGPRWGGGYRRPGTWIEYAKQFADTVNGHYVNQTLHPGFDPLQRQHSMLSAAMYDQMVVLEKGHHAPAKEVRAGSFIMPIGAKLQNGKVIPELLAQYRQELAASLQ